MTSESVDLSGKLLDGKFRLRRRLGDGGMSTVWEAENLLVHKSVAIKLMHPEISANPHTLSRFRNEATSAGRIGSPHICDILDFGQCELGPYIVMEMMVGQDFGHLLEEYRQLEPGIAVLIIRQALRGLIAAHKAGIIHRDLKPENVFLHEPEPGRIMAKLLDFGISKFTEVDTGGKTATGMLMGTPAYMSPEQTQGAGNVDARTDIWAIGVMLYYALTGVEPFAGQTMAAVLVALSTKEPTPVLELAPHVEPGLAAIVQKCLEKDPSKRLGSAEELWEELAPFEQSYSGRQTMGYAGPNVSPPVDDSNLSGEAVEGPQKAKAPASVESSKNKAASTSNSFGRPKAIKQEPSAKLVIPEVVDESAPLNQAKPISNSESEGIGMSVKVNPNANPNASWSAELSGATPGPSEDDRWSIGGPAQSFSMETSPSSAHTNSRRGKGWKRLATFAVFCVIAAGTGYLAFQSVAGDAVGELDDKLAKAEQSPAESEAKEGDSTEVVLPEGSTGESQDVDSGRSTTGNSKEPAGLPSDSVGNNNGTSGTSVDSASENSTANDLDSQVDKEDAKKAEATKPENKKSNKPKKTKPPKSDLPPKKPNPSIERQKLFRAVGKYTPRQLGPAGDYSAALRHCRTLQQRRYAGLRQWSLADTATILAFVKQGQIKKTLYWTRHRSHRSATAVLTFGAKVQELQLSDRKPRPFCVASK